MLANREWRTWDNKRRKSKQAEEKQQSARNLCSIAMTCSAKTPATLGFWNPKKITALSAANGSHQPQFREVNLPDHVKKVSFYQYRKFLHLTNITSLATALHLIFQSQPSHQDGSNSGSITYRDPSQSERGCHELVIWWCFPNRYGIISFKAGSLIFTAIGGLSHQWLKPNCITDSVSTQCGKNTSNLLDQTACEHEEK